MGHTKYYYERADAALKKLAEEGYTIDFNIEFEDIAVHADNYQIDQLYRYEGITNPDDETSVYGIQNKLTGVKGVFIAGNLSFIEGKKRDLLIALEIKGKNEIE